jgi:hypothetical protein
MSNSEIFNFLLPRIHAESYLTIDKMITDEGQNLNFNNLRSAYTRAVSI